MNSSHLQSSAPLLDLRNVRVVRGIVRGSVTRGGRADGGTASGGAVNGRKIALDDFSLRIHANEHVAVLGPNGCGKSTLIKTITRECYPMVREGSSMAILGQKSWNVFALRSLLGVVSNDLMSSCTGDASGLDVVLSGFFSSTRIFPNHTFDSKQRKLAEAALAQLGVSHLAGACGRGNVFGRGQARFDRPGARSQAASALVRRALQLSGHFGAAQLARNDALARAIGHWHYSRHA